MRRNPISRSLVVALAAGYVALSSGAVALADSSSEKKKTEAETSKTCKVALVDPHPTCTDSEQCLKILHELTTAYSAGDLKTFEHFLDDHAAICDENTKKTISGKQNILKELEAEFVDHAPGGKDPLLSYTIDQPYAKVTKDMCVVTFVATRKVGGANPRTDVANVTDVFVKHSDGQWKKLWWRGAWHPEKSTSST